MSRREPLVSVDVVALGEQLRERRKALGLKQEQLADRVGISRIYVQTLERGRLPAKGSPPANPSLAVLAALCRELRGRVIIDMHTDAGVVVEWDADAFHPHGGSG